MNCGLWTSSSGSTLARATKKGGEPPFFFFPSGFQINRQTRRLILLRIEMRCEPLAARARPLGKTWEFLDATTRINGLLCGIKWVAADTHPSAGLLPVLNQFPSCCRSYVAKMTFTPGGSQASYRLLACAKTGAKCNGHPLRNPRPPGKRQEIVSVAINTDPCLRTIGYARYETHHPSRRSPTTSLGLRLSSEPDVPTPPLVRGFVCRLVAAVIGICVNRSIETPHAKTKAVLEVLDDDAAIAGFRVGAVDEWLLPLPLVEVLATVLLAQPRGSAFEIKPEPPPDIWHLINAGVSHEPNTASPCRASAACGPTQSGRH